MTVRQLVQEFGLNNVSESVKKHVGKRNLREVD